jgi:hypothetical protein
MPYGKTPVWLTLRRVHLSEMSYPPHLPCCMGVWCYMIGSEDTDVTCVSTFALVNDIYAPSMGQY